MAKNFNMGAFVATVAAALVMNSVVVAAATTHNVGDALTWTIPPSAEAYSNWAANNTFSVGDTLVFTFVGGHDVAHVTKEAFDACNATSPISLETTSPANFTLNSTGELYYFCTFPGHCARGQKLAINVTGAASPAPQPSTPSPSTTPPAPAPTPGTPTTTPPPAPTPETPTTTPPPAPTPETPTTTPPPAPTPGSTNTTPSTPPPTPSAATSLGVAGLSATFLSIALAFLY